MVGSRRELHSAAATGRLRWVDLARGFAIILVVLGHSRSKVLVEFHGSPWATGVWQAVDTFLPLVRMPLFFTISGLLAAGALSRAWAAVMRRRVLNLYWVYLIWLVIGTVIFNLVPFNTSMPNSALKFAAEMVVGISYLWYLYALIVFFCIAKLFAHLRWLLLVVSVLAAVVLDSGTIHQHIPGNLESMIRSFPFFVLGGLFSRFVTQLVNKHAVLLMILGVVATVILVTLWTDSGIGAVRAAVSFAGAAAVLGLFRILDCAPGLDLFAHIGARTLSVYVMHVPVLAGITWVLIGIGVSRLPDAVYLAFPLLVTVAAVAICLAVRAILTAAHVEWLFELPRFRTAPARTSDQDATASV